MSTCEVTKRQHSIRRRRSALAKLTDMRNLEHPNLSTIFLNSSQTLLQLPFPPLSIPLFNRTSLFQIIPTFINLDPSVPKLMMQLFEKKFSGNVTTFISLLVGTEQDYGSVREGPAKWEGRRLS